MMSKEREDLKVFKPLKPYSCEFQFYSDYKKVKQKYEFLNERYLSLEKALKRNEPMRITQTSIEKSISLFDCPNCGTTMYYEGKPEDWKYCIECGQALDWGERK